MPRSITPNIGIKVGGAGHKAFQHLVGAIDYIEDSTMDALLVGMEPIATRSQELVPVDTGALRSSMRFEVDHLAAGPRVTLTYGQVNTGTDARNPTKYALIVHEDLSAFHQPPTQAKYLEAAFQEKGKEIEYIVADFMRGVVKKSRAKRAAGISFTEFAPRKGISKKTQPRGLPKYKRPKSTTKTTRRYKASTKAKGRSKAKAQTRKKRAVKINHALGFGGIGLLRSLDAQSREDAPVWRSG